MANPNSTVAAFRARHQNPNSLWAVHEKEFSSWQYPTGAAQKADEWADMCRVSQAFYCVRVSRTRKPGTGPRYRCPSRYDYVVRGYVKY